MLERAAAVVDSGRVAILDATHSSRALRDPVRRWAAERGTRAFLVEVTCSAPVTLARLAARAKAGRDPSDAGPELHAQSAASFQPPAEWPAGARAKLATDAEDWRKEIPALARGLHLRGSRVLRGESP